MHWLEWTVVALVGYLVGAIPFAVIIARRHGVDILQTGSGNPGATNVKRIIGKSAGTLCFTLDTLKGVAAAGWMRPPGFGSDPALLSVIGLLFAILGHSFSVFIKFKGGKGIATTMGGLAVIMPWVLLLGLGLWVIVFQTSRYVSLASIVFGASLPLNSLLLGRGKVELALALVLAILILLRHRANIARLLQGTENRFSRTR